MKFTETFTYSDTDVESVYALVSDAAFREESAAKSGGTEIEVTVEPYGDGHVVTIVRSQTADMPDVIKKFVGDTVKVKQTETWGGPDASGNRSADLKFTVIGQPADMTGTATLTQGDDPLFTLEGDVKVNVPFLGKKIEPEIVKAIVAGVRYDVDLGNERL
jgi:hypothetical protein